MRIASIYLPSLPLQVFLRSAPQHVGASVACLGRDGSTVVACSRAAWAAGIRPGMHQMAAHELASIVVPHDAAAERAALRAVAEALLAIGERVDLGGEPTGAHHAIYVAVPARTRGATFGNRLGEVMAAQGLRVRIGIADDRFTAWVAASMSDGEVVSVPRGGSAAFLAPLPISLLDIPAEVQGVLGLLGVRTLGEFAALPPPSVSNGARAWDADYQALARGDGGDGLRAFQFGGKVVERVAVGGEIGVGAALGLVAQRVAARLAGRGRAAASLQVRTDARVIDVPLSAPTADDGDLSDVIGRALHEGGAATFVELEVTVEVGDEAPRAPAAVATPIVAEGSGPLIHRATAEPAVFRLTSPAAPIELAPRRLFETHRRTRRGKQRPRTTFSAQSRLFR